MAGSSHTRALEVPPTDANAAFNFISTWFDGCSSDTVVSLFGLPTAATLCVTLGDLKSTILEHGIEHIVFGGIGGRGFENIYFGVSPLKARLPARRRGTKKDVRSVLGAWLDLDTKNGDPLEDARKLHALLPCTHVVATGSGGVHMYWRTEPLNIQFGEALNRNVHAWAEHTLGHPLDRVHNADRVLRLPGSVRFPKPSASEVQRPQAVQLLYTALPELSAKQLQKATLKYGEERSMRVRNAADKHTRTRKLAFNGSKREIVGTYAIDDMFDAAVNERVSWEYILRDSAATDAERWTCTDGPDSAGRMTWMRPCGPGMEANPRSVVVDWEESPHVMSLLSEAPETGLRELHEAGIPLTKFWVFYALRCGNNAWTTYQRLGELISDKNKDMDTPGRTTDAPR